MVTWYLYCSLSMVFVPLYPANFLGPSKIMSHLTAHYLLSYRPI